MAFSESYMLPGLRLLARLKRLRGSVLDPFGWTRERRMERRLRDDYLALVEDTVARLTPANLDAAISLLSYPDDIRGYGPVKEEAAARVEPRIAELRSRFASATGTTLTHAA
jgi:indolepyruvate ferredoxin oxidoreductase